MKTKRTACSCRRRAAPSPVELALAQRRLFELFESNQGALQPRLLPAIHDALRVE